MDLCHPSFMRAWALLVSLLLLASQPLHATRMLAFLGDSLTAGYGVETTEAYPALVEAKLKAKGLDWKVINAGVSGDTTAGGLRRLDWVFRQKVDVLFVCLGANDGMRGVPVAEADRNLGAIVDRAKAKGAIVVLAGIQIPENYGADYRKQFSAIFPRLAKTKRVTYLPFLLEGVAMRPELNQMDRIHPNAEGHKVVAETVWKVLEPVLAKHP
jgi:acyl-CoA thioesterase-1